MDYPGPDYASYTGELMLSDNFFTVVKSTVLWTLQPPTQMQMSHIFQGDYR